MIVKAMDQEIIVKSISKEEDTIILILEGGITNAQLEALQCGELEIDGGYSVYSGFTELIEHNVFLRKLNTDEVSDMKAVIKNIIEYLPDEVAIEYTELFPEMKLDGSTLMAGTRIQFCGALYRASIDLLDSEQNTPTAAPNIWNVITAAGEILDWVSGTLYSKDTKVNHSSKVWVSMVDNNSYEPGAVGVYDNIWKEVTT